MTDLAVHDGPIFAFTMTDLAVHDGPIFAFTMVRNSHRGVAVRLYGHVERGSEEVSTCTHGQVPRCALRNIFMLS